jgi:hypothetical protein
MGSVSRVLPKVGDMNDALTTQQPPPGCVRRGTPRAVLPNPPGQARYPTYRDWIKAFAVTCPKRPGDRIAKGYRLLDDRVEHRGEIAGRCVDDPQHLGHGGLSGERLVALRGPLSELAL